MRARSTLVGIGLPIILVFGCHNTPSGSNDSGAPDLRRNAGGARSDGPSTAPDSPTAIGSCTANGQTYQVGQVFVDNCITWLCTGDDVVQQVSGSVCADASIADKPAARKDARTDGAGVDGQAPEPSARPDARQPVDQGATPDLPASEVAKRDVERAIEAGPRLDVGSPDESTLKIDGPSSDGATEEDGEPTGCTYRGVTYAVGDLIPSDCNTCFCLATANIVCVIKACDVDGGAR